MTVVYILLAIAFLLYLWGCVVAYGIVTAEDEHSVESRYSRWQVAKYTLYSWGTAVISAMGHVQ